MTATPILDRRKPMPAPVSLTGNLPAGPTVAILLVLAVPVTVYALRVLHKPAVEDWLMTSLGVAGLLRLFGAGVAAYLLAVAIHEIGHALAAVAVRFRLVSVRVGPVLVNRTGASFHRRFFTGETQSTPPDSQDLARRAAVMIAGGPAANLLSPAILLLPFANGTFWTLFAIASVLIGGGELVPMEGPMVTDGRRLTMLAFDRERRDRYLTLLELLAQTTRGTPPELLPPELLARAVAVRDRSPDAVTAHALAFSAEIHHGDPTRAGELLEACLDAAGYASPEMRAAIRTDAAMYQEQVRQRPDLAEAWRADRSR